MGFKFLEKLIFWSFTTIKIIVDARREFINFLHIFKLFRHSNVLNYFWRTQFTIMWTQILSFRKTYAFNFLHTFLPYCRIFVTVFGIHKKFAKIFANASELLCKFTHSICTIWEFRFSRTFWAKMWIFRFNFNPSPSTTYVLCSELSLMIPRTLR